MNIVIRPMNETDADIIHNENLSHGWHSDIGVYRGYYAEQQSGTRRVFIAEPGGVFAGYITLRPQAAAGPFAGMGLPEIADFNVFELYRNQGVGGILLDTAEAAASESSGVVTLGVGLHSGYGAAQRMYVKRGYIPDGSGVWYRDKPLDQYAPCINDDDLILYFSKRLGG